MNEPTWTYLVDVHQRADGTFYVGDIDYAVAHRSGDDPRPTFALDYLIGIVNRGGGDPKPTERTIEVFEA